MLRIVNSRLTVLLSALVAVLPGCGGSDSTGPLPVTATVSLAAGSHVILSGVEASGAVAFPAAGAGGAEYLVVGQFATAAPDKSSGARLGGQAAVSAQARWSETYQEAPGPAVRFHDLLRRREEAAAREAWRFRGGTHIRAAPRGPSAPPTPGTQRTFKVCATIECNSFKNVMATAQWVGTHAAIFVDDSAPAGGFTSADLDQLGTQFDGTLYPVDVNAFGSESDIDGNGVVIVLLTKQVNALSPRPGCSQAFVTGFFYGLDIAPGQASQHNNGEIFYGLVPDPGGVASCARTVTEVRNILPVTFIHEFQHMISYNQHVLARPGLSEVLWLNEALAHLAEELGGLHYDSLGQQTTGRRFHIGNLYNAFIYLKSPAGNAMVTVDPPGSLESRGAQWMFVRWLVDQLGPNTSRALVQTSNLGATNVEAVAGAPFATLLGRWALTLYVHDLPGFTAPAQMRFAYWRLRATYDSLHTSFPSTFTTGFPLVPAAGMGADAQISGTVASGSGLYLLVAQSGGGAGFEVAFRPTTGGGFPGDRGSQLAIIRLR